MKKIINDIQIFAAIGLLLPVSLLSQQPNPSSTENYIMSTEYLTRTANADSALYSIMYFDGLGREKQSIRVRGTSDNKDIITHFEYDGLGRQVRDYLPAPTAQTGGQYIVDPTAAYTSYYNAAPYNTQIYYSQKKLENSPLNRVLEQGAPGNDWKLGSGHEIKFQYYSNNATEVIIYRVNPTNGNLEKGLSGTKTYAAKSLYKTTTTDENGHNIQEFKNKQGQVILKRTHVEGGTAARSTDPGTEPLLKSDTYYVYNAYGELAYVIPPSLSALYEPGNTLPSNWGDMMNNLGYAYKYDWKGRLTDKKLPGKEWEFMEYDKQDRLVAVQDAVMRTASQWLFTKYDQFGRVVYTGITSGSRSGIQAAINSAGTNNEQRISLSTGFTQNGINVKYTNTAFPTTIGELHTVNYYDYYGNIDMNGATAPTATHRSGALNADKDNSLKGLLVASSVRILNTGADDWEHTYTYYDRKSRPIYTYKKNYLGGFTKLESKLDFRSKTNETTTTHRRTSRAIEIKTLDKFFYDKNERLTRHTQIINDAPASEQLIAYNQYDKLGQLTTKRVGGNSPTGANRWQEVNYTYNIRGWLVNINNIYDMLTGNPGIPSDDLFSFRIQYNDILSGSTGYADPLYNGNIAQTFWKTSTDNTIRGYSYTYDQMNRLRAANFYKAGTSPYTGAYDESMAYDLNGNILNLVRYTGDAANSQIDMDDLTYTYQTANGESNRLMKVTDAVSGTSTGGFTNGSSGNSNDYTYDVNGNMTSDLNKDISDIVYNHLNLPEQIYFGNGNAIEYLYNASGQKVMKKVYDLTTPPSGTIKQVDYLDGFQYAGEVLQFFPHSEGYVSATPGQSNVSGTFTSYIFNYVYNYTDHLGNIRVSYSKDPVNGQLKIMEENHYYPFGLKHTMYAEPKQKYELVDNMENMARPSYVNTTDYQYKYNGKEFQDELGLGWYDYQARNYDPALGRWMNVDPLAEIARKWSPYTYAVNNPIYYIDPDGMKIDPGSQKEWDSQRKSIEDKRNDLQSKVDGYNAEAAEKGWSAEKLSRKIGDLGDRITSLDGTLSTMDVLANPENSQVYELQEGSGDTGDIRLNTDTKNIIIEYVSTKNFVHEVTHAGQFESGDIMFSSASGSGSAFDLMDEVNAYKAQYGYDSSGLGVSSLTDINSNWVQNLSNQSGEYIYSNYSTVPLNINSTMKDMIKGVPSTAGNVPKNGLNVKFKELQNAYFKK